MIGVRDQRGRGWMQGLPVLLVCLLLSPPSPSSTQQLPTCDKSFIDTHETNTSSPPLSLSCSLPTSLPALDSSQWQWSKLADDQTAQSQLLNASSTADTSTYMLTVQCGASGQYQASYITLSGDCLYSCQFFVEVTEVNPQQILATFSSLPNRTSLPPPPTPDSHTANLSYPSPATDISVGTCSSRYHLGSGCTLNVGFSWFKNGEPFEPDSAHYSVSLSNTVTIRNLSEATVGYYVCVSELPYGLGSYRTEDVDIQLSIPVSSSTMIDSPQPTEAPPTSKSSDTVLLGLEAWEVGLVATNIAVILLLFVCVCGVALCVTRRRSNGHQHPEHIPLKEMEEEEEEEEEFVDFPSPSEIPFSAIRFEDLLHKGTFKTVHHAVIHHPPSGLAGLEVAVKRLKDDCSELGSQEMMAEIYMLKSIHDKAGVHPHLVSLVGVTTNGGPLCLLLEYMPHGTLDRFLWSLKKGPVPEWYLRQARGIIQDQPYYRHVAHDLMRVTVQVAEGMCFLTQHGFVHHDLSTRNVLVGPHLHVKIGNPGMYHEGYYYVVSERGHFLHDMAPECYWEKRFSLFSDVWSFGILLYKIVTLETNPYPGVPVRDLYNHIAVNNQRPPLLSSFSNELYFLLQWCWQAIPVERPTFPLILNELQRLCTNPTKHIILKTSKDEFTPGYVSENGQVFLHSVPVYIFQPGYAARRLSSTQRSAVSSADDTIYSRETAESILYLYSSEVEDTCTGQETDEDEGGEEGAEDGVWLQEKPAGGQRGEVGEGGVARRVIGKEHSEDVTLILESNNDKVEGGSQESHDQSCDQELEDREGSQEKLIHL